MQKSRRRQGLGCCRIVFDREDKMALVFLDIRLLSG